MIDVAEFLLARFADDEQYARTVLDDDRGAARVALPGGQTRILAECDAKRRIVERYQKIQGRTQDGDVDERLTLGWVLEQMAQPYASHPDYRDDDRP